MPTTLNTASVQAILAAFKAAGGFKDDHANGEFEKRNQVAVFTRNDQTYVVPVYDDSYFCINPLYLDEETGQVHLCCGSVGGTVDNAQIPLIERLRRFNKLVPMIKNFDLGKFSVMHTIVGEDLVTEQV